ADLDGVDLSGSDLRDADLRGAHLRGAILRRADLRGADLRGADLTHADLRDADLRDVDLRGADLTGTLREGARFDARIADGTTVFSGAGGGTSSLSRTDEVRFSVYYPRALTADASPMLVFTHTMASVASVKTWAERELRGEPSPMRLSTSDEPCL